MSEQEDIAREIVESGLFNEAWYLGKYQDAALSDMAPLQHFVRFGLLLQRDPGPDFSSRRYLEAYRDVVQAKMNPLLHYIRFGKAEGRRAIV